MRLLGGDKRFVLGASGHIAGVINPPQKKKRNYWTNDAQASDAEAWLSDAQSVPGSWWPDWIEWLKGLGGKTVKAAGARIPGEGKLKAIEDAPGRYVRTR